MRWSLLVLGVVACAAPQAQLDTHKEPLPFIADDYARALTEARAAGRAIFVDTWAPWCHTCRFVRSFVLSDQALAKHAGRFVWLAIDIDQDRNADFVTRFPVPGIPTFLVIDPATEKVVLTRSASVDRAQLEQLFADGELAWKGARGGPDAAFDEGQKLAGAGEAKQAAAAFERALAAAAADWPRRRSTVEALVMARQQSGDTAGCAELADRETQTGPRDALWVSVVTSGFYCALEAKKPLLQARAREALAVAVGDDRSGLYEVLVEAEPADKKALAAEWLAFLEREAARAPTAAERAVYDTHRLLAAIALGDPGRAVPALQASERDLPDDYNGPARLAIAYLELGRYDDGLAACERALLKAYGPRRLRIEETRATLYQRKGDLASARKVLEGAIHTGEALPPSPRSQAAVARLKKLLAGLR